MVVGLDLFLGFWGYAGLVELEFLCFVDLAFAGEGASDLFATHCQKSGYSRSAFDCVVVPKVACVWAGFACLVVLRITGVFRWIWLFTWSHTDAVGRGLPAEAHVPRNSHPRTPTQFERCKTNASSNSK